MIGNYGAFRRAVLYNSAECMEICAKAAGRRPRNRHRLEAASQSVGPKFCRFLRSWQIRAFYGMARAGR